MLRPTLLAALAVVILLPAGASAAREPVLAGAAAADMTPPVGTPQFAYTADSHIFSPSDKTVTHAVKQLEDPDTALFAKTFVPTEGIHTRVYSRAIAIKQGDELYALAMADLGGLPYAMTQEVLERVADLGIDGEHLLISATHTHSAQGAIWPMDNGGYAFVGGDAFDPRIFDLTAESIAQAIRGAVAKLEPARVGVGIHELRGASRNRAGDAFRLNADIKSLTAAEQQALSIDPYVSVIRVDDAAGRPMAVWSNFAIHGTSFGDDHPFISGDNMATSARLAERWIRERTPAGQRRAEPIVNVWTNGAEGDVSPDGDNRSLGGQPQWYLEGEGAKAHLAGMRTAEGIVAAWEAAGKQMTTTPLLGARRTLMTFDGTEHGATAATAEPVGPLPILGLGIVAEGTCAPVDGMAGPGQGMKAPLVGGPPPVAPAVHPISFWQVERLGIASIPAEVTTQMGRRIQTALVKNSTGALDRVAIAGMTNAYISYTSTPEEYDKCDYEGSFTLYGRQMGYAWLDGMAGLQSALMRGEEAATLPEPPSLATGSSASTPPRVTAAAGTPVAQPANTTRYGQATFSWQGGDPQVDAPRGRTFVALQRQVGEVWLTVDTDESFSDTVARAKGDVWTETYQFDRCAPLGTYRFLVTGKAVKANTAPAENYTVASQPFAVGPVAIGGVTSAVAGDQVEIRALYPKPATGLLALPRLVTDGEVRIGGHTIQHADADGAWRAPASQAGGAITVTDGCGNTGAA